MIDWIFKDDAQPIETTDFWYDLTDGGYIKPDKLLEDEVQVAKLNEAIDIVESFRKAMEENELLEEV